ncbi:hypothetical protein H8959_013093 [Pygathrix nigripes]
MLARLLTPFPIRGFRTTLKDLTDSHRGACLEPAVISSVLVARVLPGEAGLSENKEQDALQEVALDISLGHIYKFLALCAQAQPGAYTDENLVGLIELLCRAGLDVGLRLLPKVDLQQLLLLLLENIREWPGKLQELCCTLSWVSDHHHNLLALVQFFPDMTSRSRSSVSRCSTVLPAAAAELTGCLHWLLPYWAPCPD